MGKADVPGRHSAGCPLLQVCVHLDGLNAENTFHCFIYIYIKSNVYEIWWIWMLKTKYVNCILWTAFDFNYKNYSFLNCIKLLIWIIYIFYICQMYYFVVLTTFIFYFIEI